MKFGYSFERSSTAIPAHAAQRPTARRRFSGLLVVRFFAVALLLGGCVDNTAVKGVKGLGDVVADGVADGGTLGDGALTEDAVADGAGAPCGKSEDCAKADSTCMKVVCGAAKTCEETPLAKGDKCSDDDECTPDDTCDDKGVCLPGAATSCDDGNPCTTDSCDKIKGCVHADGGTDCSDGDACTEGDSCAAGACSPGMTKVCDDGDVCTDDSCDSVKGCVATPNTGACDDGDACTLGDACGNGACLPGQSTACNDDNVCTDDGCDKKTGCLNLANAVTCSDGDACTAGDACKDGGCAAGPKADCDDGNLCTTDSCDVATGCVYEAACTDDNLCTTDTCDAVKGCQYAALQDGATCGGTGLCAKGGCFCPAASFLQKAGCSACGCDTTGSVSTGSLKLGSAVTMTGAAPSDYFGRSVARSGDWMAVGAPGDDDNGTDSGSVMMLQRQVNGTWAQKAKLHNGGAVAADIFGLAVALDSGTLIAGAPGDYGKGSSSGAAFVFALQSDGTWKQTAKLLAPDGKLGDKFGLSVGISGSRVAIGAPFRKSKAKNAGGAYVFDKQANGTWMVSATLTTATMAGGDYCGWAIAISAGRIAAGCRGDDNKGMNSGSVGVFELQKGATWKQAALLTAKDGAANDYFGAAVAIDGDRIVAGAFWNDAKGADSGSAYIFSRKVGTWSQSAKLVPSDGAKGDNFGFSVAIRNSTLLVGAPYDDDKASNSGSVYPYMYNAAKGWLPASKYVGAGSDVFLGMSVALGATGGAIGAPGYSSGRGEAHPLTTSTYACDKAGKCACRPGYVGDKCATISDVCLIPKACDDKNACTTDSCDKVKGCLHAAAKDDTACTDGSLCTAKDTCQTGTCMSGTKVVCTDGNLCTTDTCDAAKGCQYASLKDGTTCGGAGLCAKEGCVCPAESFLQKASCSACGCETTGSVATGSLKLGSAVAMTGAAPSDQFGSSVARSGDWMAVGAPGDDDNGSESGSVTMFQRQTAGTWPQKVKLHNGGAVIQDYFGSAVALDSGTLIAGARGEDDKGSMSGAAFVFALQSNGTWKQTAKLLAPDGQLGDEFGYSVGISGSRVAIGAPYRKIKGNNSGGAYVFDKQANGTWTVSATLTTATIANSDSCGTKIAISAGRFALGCPSDDDNGKNSGSVGVFELQTGTTWKQVALLTAKDGAAGDSFGSAVAIDGDWIVAGAFRDDDKGNGSGSAYIFARKTGTWSQSTKLVASDGAAFDYFGSSVAIRSSTLLIGALYDDDKGTDSGSIYPYTYSAAKGWLAANKLVGASSGDHFGQSVALSENGGAIGAPGYSFSRGEAYPLTTASYACDKAGKCACMPGYSGDKCANIIDVCLIPNGCDDGNGCTIDTCTSKKCIHSSATNGTSCATGMICKVGQCVVSDYGTAANPATSCLDLLTMRPALKGKNSKYYIKTSKKTSLSVYCDMTTDGGGYTFYPVASGIRTYRYTDNDSCKAIGLTMVMPRSKAQWSSLLNRYATSYFKTIPGVYRASSGGSYTNCIMRNPKNYGSGCKNWRVGDGGRWWLRDSTYSEPSGDYTANCWLGQSDWNVNHIGFDDGNCSYSTIRYICSTNDKK